MRDSMVFYRSFYEAVKDLPSEDFKKAVCALMEYGLNEVVPEGTGIEKTIYIMAKPQIDKNYQRYANGKSGGRKPNCNQTITKPEPNHNQLDTKCEPNVNVNDNVNVNVNDKESNKRTKFVPPTRQDVAEYCREKGYSNVDVERFIDFYSCKGWMVGKNKMKDWKAAVRNWARSEKATKPNNTKGNKFNNFSQRQYDYDDLEKRLLNSNPVN